MIRKIPKEELFNLVFEVGQYYMGYENPSNITDYS